MCKKESFFYCHIVSEQDVMDLERRYWLLRSNVPKFDVTLFTSLVSPPVPSALCASKQHHVLLVETVDLVDSEL